MNELALFNNIFNDMMDDAFPVYSSRTTFNAPKVDVKENKDNYLLSMDLPGRTEKDVDIEINNNVLTISSHVEDKKEEKADKHENGKWLMRERHCYSFSRSFTLPDDIKAEAVKASFKNGVLDITIPRKALAAPKRIAITAA